MESLKALINNQRKPFEYCIFTYFRFLYQNHIYLINVSLSCIISLFCREYLVFNYQNNALYSIITPNVFSQINLIFKFQHPRFFIKYLFRILFSLSSLFFFAVFLKPLHCRNFNFPFHVLRINYAHFFIRDM